MARVEQAPPAGFEDVGIVADAVLIASRVLVALAARSIAAASEEITLLQFRTLVVLQSRGPQRPGDLAETLAISPSTGTRLCDRLVTKGFISRIHGEVDRRSVTLDLTPSGRSLVDDVFAWRRAEIVRIVERIPVRRRHALVTALCLFGEVAGEIPGRTWATDWDL